MSPTLRPARPEEANRLTEIAMAAKASWGYPAEWLEIWRPELTFDERSIERHWVLVAEVGGGVAGVVALEGPDSAGDLELAHLWIDPPAMGRGLGRRLLEAAVAEARRRGTRRVTIVSDPYAVPFYERFGARMVGEAPGTPAGRTLPRMELDPHRVLESTTPPSR